MSTVQALTIKLPPELAAQMPKRQAERQQVVVLGLTQLRIKKALQKYQQGGCSLAYAAQQAGISLWEMVPFAYAYGLKPRIDPSLLEGELTPGQAARL